MISLHSVLAGGLIGMIPTFFTVISVIVLALAFIMGFTKGFRKVSWNGLTWLTAGVLYATVAKSIRSDASATLEFALSLIIAVACVAVSMVAFGILGHFLRPRVRWVKDDANSDTSLAEYGLEFEPEYLDYDGEDDIMPYGKRIHKTGLTPPNVFGRLFGGVSCAVNVAMILWVIAGVCMFAVEATMLKSMGYDVIFAGAFAQQLFGFVKLYLLDFVTIGIIIAIARKGYYTGFVSSLRSFIVTVGGIAGVAVAFYLPFSDMANTDVGLSYFLNKLVVRCMNMFEGIGGSFSGIIGRIFAGVVLAVIISILMALLNALLAKCCKMVSSSRPTRWIDACLACLLYMVIGVAIVVACWFLISAFDYFGVLRFGEIIEETSRLSNGLFRFARGVVETMVAPLLGK